MVVVLVMFSHGRSDSSTISYSPNASLFNSMVMSPLNSIYKNYNLLTYIRHPFYFELMIFQTNNSSSKSTLIRVSTGSSILSEIIIV